jgi:hypothetical protein
MYRYGKDYLRFIRASSSLRDITHLGFCVEVAHTHNKDKVLLYVMDFKEAFPFADHDQLVRTLSFLGLP